MSWANEAWSKSIIRVLLGVGCGVDPSFQLLAAPLSGVGLDAFRGIVPNLLPLDLMGGISLRGLSVIKGVELPIAIPGLINRCGAVGPSGSIVLFCQLARCLVIIASDPQ
jgi:hypothetical protein